MEETNQPTGKTKTARATSSGEGEQTQKPEKTEKAEGERFGAPGDCFSELMLTRPLSSSAGTFEYVCLATDANATQPYRLIAERIMLTPRGVHIQSGQLPAGGLFLFDSMIGWAVPHRAS